MSKTVSAAWSKASSRGRVGVASVLWRQALEVRMVFVLDESCSQMQELPGNSRGHWSHCYLQVGTATPSRVEVAF